MTRINATIPPAALCDQHLVAEYKEILRTNALATKKPLDVKRIPSSFTLGTGHVLFFYDKLKYIHHRFESLRNELLQRGYIANITYDGAKIQSEYPHLYNDWSGTDEANDLVIDRIYERALTMKKITWYRNILTPDDYLILLKKSLVFSKPYHVHTI